MRRAHTRARAGVGGVTVGVCVARAGTSVRVWVWVRVVFVCLSVWLCVLVCWCVLFSSYICQLGHAVEHSVRAHMYVYIRAAMQQQATVLQCRDGQSGLHDLCLQIHFS